MKQPELGKRLKEARIAKKMTQSEVVGTFITRNMLSQIESGKAMPSVETLQYLAEVLGIPPESLISAHVQTIEFTDEPSLTQNVFFPYEQRYQIDDYYWGTEPNDLAYEVLKLTYPTRPMKLLDIGCGEGRDAVFFARNGFEVTAFDVAESGIEKAKKLAAANNVHVNFFQADLKHFSLTENYDVIYASGVIHHIRPEWRDELFEMYREHTVPGGINAFNVFVQKPYIPVPPDSDGDDDTWYSGELLRIYADWHIPVFREEEFQCPSGDIPHLHCMDVLIARKPK